MARKSTATTGQLAALFPADLIAGTPGLGIAPDENGDQLDIFGAIAEATAEDDEDDEDDLNGPVVVPAAPFLPNGGVRDDARAMAAGEAAMALLRAGAYPVVELRWQPEGCTGFPGSSGWPNTALANEYGTALGRPFFTRPDEWAIRARDRAAGTHTAPALFG